MALHPSFPKDPHKILDPKLRWFPAEETLREQRYDHLMPPLVDSLRKKVKIWRDENYAGATETSIALLNWWFKTEHLIPGFDGMVNCFEYYFAQREGIETIIYLYDVVKAKDKYDLLRFDSHGSVSAGMFDETWQRYVVKMATGSGKTKLLSLALAWSYFHKLYEPNSTLARNFLVIAPNIIVLDRIRNDFDGLKIFFEDPVIPDNGFNGQNWQDDFQLSLHIQDEIRIVNKTGNIFLTNIHRVYESNDQDASFIDEDTTSYFLGAKPVTKTNESQVDLGKIVREIDEIAILNDEAHHVHNPKLAWFKSIQDIHNQLLQKGSKLSIQIDVTATPRHNNGSIFVQTIADYPLVEAIAQDVVKHPVLPDLASRAKLSEKQSSRFSERYEDYLHLGYLEWKKAYDEHIKLNKKAILFIMTDDTKNCDEVAEFLENAYPELKGAVLTIHTNKSGEITETVTSKNRDELELLRKQANEIDSIESPYKAIVSVLMLKEGWDVKNVTTIVGLRAYSSKSNILPEQTLGRGLRRMYRGQDVTEYVSVIGTDAFMDFVESIKSEGVELERTGMGNGTKPKAPLVIEVDQENPQKDIEKLEIEIPILTPRIFREYKNLSALNPDTFSFQTLLYKNYTEAEQREIIFRDIAEDYITHTTQLESRFSIDPQNVIGFFTRAIMRELRLISGYDVLYEKVKYFIQNLLFGQLVIVDDLNTVRNLSATASTRTILETFFKAINQLTILDKGEAEINGFIKVGKCRPFVTNDQSYILPKKSVFNKIIGDSYLELEFAAYLDNCTDIISFVKNYFGLGFKIDYQNANGGISNYYPDFIVKETEKRIWIIETKGNADLDVPLKIQRLKQWCEDINIVQDRVNFNWLYVEEEKYRAKKLYSFKELVAGFK
ncbi:DEAD/DEAH box helicase family protein [Mucilaginibacter arboris]|uniref:Type III restriction endonuclease subunit R n=1 Tax=Mucilaginibacter arboris TaxID=2682090 RepID=A0A7K1SYK5_9SPHI|nr:DEAD/DEAH box helicase family protein [Mucilaginibacter arboris]MVN22383.1 type III restriction endonuclease subunit R [Mucilaginibacter arboris]